LSWAAPQMAEPNGRIRAARRWRRCRKRRL